MSLLLKAYTLVISDNTITTEEAWQAWREEIDNSVDLSCHLLTNQELPNIWNDLKLETRWKNILELRDAFLFFHEKMRNAK